MTPQQSAPPEPVSFLVFSGSLRAGSLNTRLAALAQAHEALDPDGRIASDSLRRRFERTVAAFMELVEAAKHYPCVKSRWIEFLGERPDPAVDRVE